MHCIIIWDAWRISLFYTFLSWLSKGKNPKSAHFPRTSELKMISTYLTPCLWVSVVWPKKKIIARCIQKHQEQKKHSPKSTPLVDHSSSLIRDRDSLGSWKRSLVLRLGKWKGICPSKRLCIEIQRWRKVSQWTQLFGKVGGWYGISLNGGPRSKAGSWLIRMASPLPGGTKLLCNEAGQVVDRASHYVHIDLTSNDTNTSLFVTDFVESCPC